MMETKEMLDEIVDLPVEKRVQLADQILQTLNPVDPAIQQQWIAEVHQRMEAVRKGESELIPGEDVFRKAHHLVEE
jgi:putative addiction module component (TIGR02574 family)